MSKPRFNYPMTPLEEAIVDVTAIMATVVTWVLSLALLVASLSGCGYAAEHWLPRVTGQNSATTWDREYGGQRENEHADADAADAR